MQNVTAFDNGSIKKIEKWEVLYEKRFNENRTIKAKLQEVFLRIFSNYNGCHNITAKSGGICIG